MLCTLEVLSIKAQLPSQKIARFFEQVLHIQLGNTSMTFQEILRRKESTAFLERLKEKLDDHIERIDERNIR